MPAQIKVWGVILFFSMSTFATANLPPPYPCTTQPATKPVSAAATQATTQPATQPTPEPAAVEGSIVVPAGSEIRINIDGTDRKSQSFVIKTSLSQPAHVIFTPLKLTGKTLRTAHYDLYVEGMDPQEVADLAETLHARLKQFFGSEPRERLQIKVLTGKERFRDATGETYDEGFDGMYVPLDKTGYIGAWEGPFENRGTVLHECTHQFHFLTRTKNESPQDYYYVEGLAEHFSKYCWDGHKADPGKLSTIDVDNAPEFALKDFARIHHGSIRELGCDPRTSQDADFSFGEAWGLVSFLLSKHCEQFKAWSAALDRGEGPAPAWDTVFAKDSDKQLSHEYQQWLESQQQPWSVVSGDWQLSGQRTLEGVSTDSETAWAHLKHPISLLSADVETDGTHQVYFIAGSLRTSDDSYEELAVKPNGDVWRHKYVKGKYVLSELLETTHIRDPRRFKIEVRQENGSARIRIDGADIMTVKVPKDGGTELGTDGAVKFRNLVTR